ncbi:MAG TPA: hybrid sensor histidine kinase/response regulator [Steroidobacteraceae bacterium]|nr:hybrid sensor histidine kinase/response regulator [Steroidobacteraceae bacterium]
MQSLVAAVAALAAARHLDDVTRIVRQSARALTGADGVTFVLREGTDCYYADEEAIAPLWKGKRFPMETCISGWAMLNRQAVAIEDIYLDARIPHDAYRVTFVKSLLMMPVGETDPAAAVGAYWAETHLATTAERETLQAIANAAALALANIHLNSRLEHTLEREREARRTAESAAKAKDDFLATVSHELRTPLHVIQNWIWQMKQMPEGENALKRALEIIDRNTELQARLIEDLLDMSQSVHGKLHVQTQLVDLGNVCTMVIELCQPAARAKQIRLDYARVSLPYVWGDPVRLQQVLWNVLANAIKFTPENGRVVLRLVRGPRHVCVAIEDSGIGVEPEFLPRMFDRFTQADQSPTRRFGGLGVGLAIVKDLVALHGGTVRAESRGRYQGTTVTMEFPIPALMDQPTKWLQEPIKHRESRLDGIAILLVDDDDQALTAVENVLRGHGADVIRASSTEQALALLEQRQPTLIIADLSMPDRDGLDLIRSIRLMAEPRGKLPAAVLTAHTATEHGRTASEAGFQMFIEKPVRPDVFVGQIAKLAGLH